MDVKECHFCHKPVTEDHFCIGCFYYVCPNCDWNDIGGKHRVEQHQEPA